MKTTELWSGQFGTEYTERNRVNWQARMPFWQSAIEACTPATVFEFGCNAGWNLKAIAAVAPSTELFGCDINLNAVNEARAEGFDVQHVGAQGIVGLYQSGSIDLVFTAGVLIHIASADLERVMRSIAELSGRFVLAVEYHEEEGEVEVEYRGHKGALWRRNYGQLYQNLGLQLLSVTPDAEGFDNCTAYLLEKPQ